MFDGVVFARGIIAVGGFTAAEYGSSSSSSTEFLVVVSCLKSSDLRGHR
jgi:hypothetical protein